MRWIWFLLLSGGVAAAQWSAGAGAADITPSEPVWMAGYASRTKPSEGVRQKIFVKALALRDGAGRTALAVTLDLVGIKPALAEKVAAVVKERHGIPRERILLNVSHTHSAPLVGDVSTYRHLMGDAHEAASRRYTEALPGKIVDAIGKAIASMAPATLHFGQGFAGFAVNRRRVTNRAWPGPVDHDVPVLAVRANDGKLRAALFGYACHNTVLSDYLIGGDYAGYAQAALETTRPDAVAMFVQGAGADANPLPRRSEELARRYGMTLADAVEEVLKGKMRPVAGNLAAALETADLRFAGPPSRAELEQRVKGKDDVARRHAERLLARMDREGSLPSAYPMPVQVWKFGGTFALLALGGELTADYSLRFKARYGWDRTWVAGYSNDVFTYVPSLRVLREGGYEGGGATLYTALPGPFTEEVEDAIAAAVERAVKAAR